MYLEPNTHIPIRLQAIGESSDFGTLVQIIPIDHSVYKWLEQSKVTYMTLYEHF